MVKNKREELAKEEIDKEKKLVTNVYLIGDSIFQWFSNAPYVNKGHCGYLTRDIIWMLEDESDIKGETAILLIGINDILCNIALEKIQNNYKIILNELLLRFKKLIILDILPTDSLQINNNINLINKYINDLISKKNNSNKIFLLNINDKLIDNSSKLKLIKNLYTTDGIHLSRFGYDILSEEIKNKLSEINLKI